MTLYKIVFRYNPQVTFSTELGKALDIAYAAQMDNPQDIITVLSIPTDQPLEYEYWETVIQLNALDG